jgi:uncharacterized protein
VTAFVDSTVFYAGIDRSDIDHQSAAAILQSGEALVTSDHVLVETWMLLRRRLGRAVADTFWSNVRSGSVRLEVVGAQDIQSAWSIGERFADQDFSIVDRTSFALMERLAIHRAASLDSDFAVYRFGPRLERAFEIVRP